MYANNHKVGDRVKIVPRGDSVWNAGMAEKGDIVTIHSIVPFDSDREYYKIEEDDQIWWWCDLCFIPVEENVTNKVLEVLRG